MVEDNVRTFAENWTGTGEISGSSDAEQMCVDSGEYMISEVVYTDTRHVRLRQNVYDVGDTAVLKYRHGDSDGACQSAEWTLYESPFLSLGYVQVRVEAA